MTRLTCSEQEYCLATMPPGSSPGRANRGFLGVKSMSRRLKTIAKEINESIPDLGARLERGYCDTDRKIGRLRVPGKGRHGNRLIVTYLPTGQVVYEHNSAEPYRINAEVEVWLERWKAGCHEDRWGRLVK